MTNEIRVIRSAPVSTHHEPDQNENTATEVLIAITYIKFFKVRRRTYKNIAKDPDFINLN
jgi:hypothetical protein